MTTPTPTPRPVSASTVYIVMGDRDYESSTALRAFAKPADATAFVDQCYEWKGRRPRGPEWDADNPPTFAEPEWVTYEAAEKAWRKAIPAGAHEFDSYYVTEVEFTP